MNLAAIRLWVAEGAFKWINEKHNSVFRKNMCWKLKIEDNNLFNLSSFKISEANYRLTLGYHGIASSFLLIITYLLFY
jgi:hypothetical protein